MERDAAQRLDLLGLGGRREDQGQVRGERRRGFVAQQQGQRVLADRPDGFGARGQRGEPADVHHDQPRLGAPHLLPVGPRVQVLDQFEVHDRVGGVAVAVDHPAADVLGRHAVLVDGVGVEDLVRERGVVRRAVPVAPEHGPLELR